MTPTEVASKLRQFNEWRRRGRDDIPQPKPCEIGKTIDMAVKILERVASLPHHITPEQAPDDMHEYCQEAAEGYADGWNDCMKAMKGEGE